MAATAVYPHCSEGRAAEDIGTFYGYNDPLRCATLVVLTRILDVVQEIKACSVLYKNNFCEGNIVPHMFQPCGEWETCMNRDPSKIGRARIGAQLLAEIVNAFVENISWKTFVSILVIFLSLRGTLTATRFSFSPSSRSHFPRFSSTLCLHSIGQSTITHHTPHLHRYPNRSTSYHPRRHAEASLVPIGSMETTEMTLGPQQGGGGWAMVQSPGFRATDMTICESWTPQKTCSIRFEHAHPPSFHSFDTSSRDPFTILI